MNSTANESINNAAGFLKKKVTQNAYWLSCYDNHGTPTSTHQKGFIYAAYFITKALKNNLAGLSEILKTRILAEEYENQSLWGFQKSNPAQPTPYDVDADDTAYVLHACSHLGISKEHGSLLKFYQNCLDREPGQNCIQGFKTFASDLKVSLAVVPALENNFCIHPEVNANVFALLKHTNLKQYINPEIIIQSQAPEGYWYSYFYPGLYYSTYLFLDLLRDMEGYEEQKKRGIQFILATQNNNGSWGRPGNCYETALALCSLAHMEQIGAPFKNGRHYLLKTQEVDGSWRFEELIYRWHNHDHKTWLAYDANRVVTTSLCIEALSNCLQA